MRKKRPFTLLEIMIVIFLIGLIGSIVGYNMRGSMEEGKAFKTEQAIIQMRDILEMEIAKGSDSQEVVDNPLNFLEASGIVKNPKQLLIDGWKQNIKVSLQDGELTFYSEKFEKYREKKKSQRGYDEIEDHGL